MYTNESEIGSKEPRLIAENKLDTVGSDKDTATRKMSLHHNTPPPPPWNGSSPYASGVNGSSTMNLPQTTANANGNNEKTRVPAQAPSKLVKFLSFLRTILLEMPLALLFALFIVVFILHEVHHTIFLPFLQMAERTDDDLYQEYTYYDRSCSAVDLTTLNPSDLVLSNDTTPKQAVDTFMTHGGIVFPKLLSLDTVKELRKHVQERNANLTELEEIVLSQGRNRKSFAFDASEAPIVSQAISEVASNPLLRDTLSTLIGEDPAVSEITAITSFYGAPDQAWHQDVKADGSPLKYARTYTHSHSLFIVLQDTSAEMGASSFCPGSQYCANDGMAETCEEYGFQVCDASSDGLWHAGDGALVSQFVWHRGAKHDVQKGASSLERIMFVMTFLARPNLTKDGRQLSRGTYFHQRWNMWGHTFQDLLDCGYSMSKPFSYLRAMGLWKFPSRQWGFDLMISGLLRCANNQMGMTYEELQVFVDTVVNAKLHLPTWLQGEVTEEDDAWQTYLKTTLEETLTFIATVNVIALGVYLVLVLMVAGIRRKPSVVGVCLGRLILTHGILFLIGYGVWHHIQQSQFVVDLRAKRLLMKAFPTYDEQEAVEAIMKDPSTIPAGPLTLPERNDVLVGSRFDARFLGAYDEWLSYHPGNKVFQEVVNDVAGYYRNYSGLGAAQVFCEEIEQNVESEITRRHGRFVAQDYRSGLWNVMTETETRDYVKMSLLAASSDALADLNKEIGYMLADYRFGLKRETALAADSQDYLLHWRNNVLFGRDGDDVDESSVPSTSSSNGTFGAAPTLLSPPTINANTNIMTPLATNNKRWSNIASPPASPIEIGNVVMAIDEDDGKWYRASIVDKTQEGDFIVSYDDGGTAELEQSQLRPLVPIEEGVTRVRVNFGREGWYEGTVSFVHPSRDVDVEYDDGDFNEGVPYWKYEVVVE